MLFPCRNTPPCIATILTWAKSGRNTAKCFLLQLNVSKYKQNNTRRIRAVRCLYNDVKRSHIRPVLTVLRSESPCALSLSLARPLARPLALNKRHITPAFVVHTIWHSHWFNIRFLETAAENPFPCVVPIQHGLVLLLKHSSTLASTSCLLRMLYTTERPTPRRPRRHSPPGSSTPYLPHAHISFTSKATTVSSPTKSLLQRTELIRHSHMRNKNPVNFTYPRQVKGDRLLV